MKFFSTSFLIMFGTVLFSVVALRECPTCEECGCCPAGQEEVSQQKIPDRVKTDLERLNDYSKLSQASTKKTSNPQNNSR